MGNVRQRLTEKEQHAKPSGRRVDWLLSLGLVSSAAFYRPLAVWAANPWELSSPSKLIQIGLAVTLLGFACGAILTVFSRDAVGSAIAVCLVVLTLGHWIIFRYPMLVLLAACMSAVVALRLGTGLKRGVAVTLIVALGAGQVFSVVLSHLQTSDAYPLLDLTERTSVEATGHVEDVLVVVLDSYPSLAVAERWFHHDASWLTSELTNNGFTVPEIAWSYHSSTSLAVPGMLELRPLVDEGPTAHWDNLAPSYRLIRGDNLVASSLKSAGFEYRHIEGGWDGSDCGNVDICVEGPWSDDVVWTVAGPSIFRDWLIQTYGSYGVRSSIHAAESIESLSPIFDDGHRDYVFTHIWLPHSPFVVDSECEVRTRLLHKDGSTYLDLESLRNQLACVDSLIVRMTRAVGDRTAVMITSDHGSRIGGMRVLGSEWTDSDIAEGLGIFLTYRLPDNCPKPERATNLDTMRSIVSCSIEIDLPPIQGNLLMGAENPVRVDPARLRSIEARLLDGEIEAGR